MGKALSQIDSSRLVQTQIKKRRPNNVTRPDAESLPPRQRGEAGDLPLQGERKGGWLHWRRNGSPLVNVGPSAEGIVRLNDRLQTKALAFADQRLSTTTVPRGLGMPGGKGTPRGMAESS